MTAKCDVDDDDEEILEEAPPEDCGHRFRTPTDYYQADFSNIMYKYPDEAEVINMCYHGAGYDAGSGVDQGFVNVSSQLDSLIDETPPCRTIRGTSR